MQLFCVVLETLCTLGLIDLHPDRRFAGMRDLYQRKINLFYLLGKRLGAPRCRSVDAGEDDSTNNRYLDYVNCT